MDTSELEPVRRRLAALRELRPSEAADFLQRVRDVVIIASSSRGGSSVFAEMLRFCPVLTHFRAEVNPFFALAGLAPPDSGDSDRLSPGAPHDRGLLEAELALDVGGRAPLEARGERAFGLDLAWRLSAQWPTLAIDPAQVVAWTRSTLAAWGLEDLAGFHLALLREVRAAHPQVDPWYYDIDPARIRAAFPELEPPTGPPGPVVLEEPPFVLTRPWRPATAADLDQRPLIIKTPSNAYRLPFLRTLFSGARLRVLHLVRNPAAAINGLHDGWRFRGFHAHRVGGLDIAGYSDAVPGGQGWWKYDLPPGWQAWRGEPLEAVCGFQWRAAHSATLEWAAENRPELLRVRFEDLVGERARRRRAWGRVTDWLGVRQGPALERIVEHGIPPVMATQAPRRRRWFAKATLLEPVLSEPRTRELAAELGYADPGSWV